MPDLIWNEDRVIGKVMPKHDKQMPLTRRGFTRFDQIDQLVGASEADPDLGFMARLMALCSLPRTNPGNRLQYKRQNGPYKLIMSGHRGSQAPLWQPTPPHPVLALHRSGADSKPRNRSRPITLHVHAEARYQQHQRREPG